MSHATLSLTSNLGTGAAVLVADLGVLIPSAGGSETFSLTNDIEAVRTSADVRALTTDGAYPGAPDPSAHTLILKDANGNIVPPDEIDFFLAPPSTAETTLVVRSYVGGVTANDVVYQTSPDTVDRADASAVATSAAVIGMVDTLDEPSVGKCLVRFNGDLAGFTGLVAGEIYLLSTTPGGIVGETDTGNVNYPDTTPGSGEVTREVGVAVNSTTLFVDTQRDFEQN